jgi:hypothetical protein
MDRHAYGRDGLPNEDFIGHWLFGAQNQSLNSPTEWPPLVDQYARQWVAAPRAERVGGPFQSCKNTLLIIIIKTRLLSL